MRRALIGTLAGWVTGAAGVLAQSPLPPMPSPYANYAPPAATAQNGQPSYGPVAQPNYGPVAQPNYGPVPQPNYGPVPQPNYGPVAQPNYGPAYAPAPTYGPSFGQAYAPVMTASGMVPPNGVAQPLPPGYPVPSGPGGPVVPEGQLPPPTPVPGGGMPGPMGPAPYGAMPNAPMYNGAPLLGPNPGWYGPGQNMDGSCGMCGDCGTCSKCPCGACGPEGRVWGSVELLLWWTQGQYIPPLLAHGGIGNPGVIGRAGTVIAYGDSTLDDYMRQGLRLRAGFWIDECHTCGVEGSFFWIGQAATTFRSECVVGDFLGRPFFNIDPAVNAQDAEIVCAPGVLCGDFSVSTTSEFYGADVNIRRNLCCNCDSRIDVVGGFRYLHLSDSLIMTEHLINLDPARGAVGEGFVVNDNFGAVNNFYGGQFGVAGEIRYGKFFTDWRALVALGSTVHQIVISGSTTFYDPAVPGGNPVRQPGGLLAQPSNIGTYTLSSFSVVPEGSVNVGYSVSPNIRVYAGYTFMYWTEVARAGEQINQQVDARQLPTRVGPGVGIGPTFTFRRSDLWAQGVSFGVQLRY